MRSRRQGFAALRNRNFRLYLLGQTVSQAGTWMQTVAQAWLVLHLTDSGTALGVVIALQALPVLLFAPLGGLLADRVDKRRLLIFTQVGAAVPALALWALTTSGDVQLWMVYVLAAALGFVNVFDNPARQAFVLDVVGPENLTSAVSLNNVNFNAARILGPALAGITIETIGIGPCFLFNAVSYGAVIIALLAMRRSEFYPSASQVRGRHQLRDGMIYVRRTPELFVPICMMLLVGTMTYETQVTIPLLAKHTFNGDAGTFSAMTVAMGLGAVVGGMLIAVHLSATRRNLLRVTAALGLVTVLSALAPTLAVGARRADGARRQLGRVSGRGQLHPSALVALRHAGAGDVAVVDGVHRLEPCRRTPRRRHRPAFRSQAGRPGRRTGPSRRRRGGLAHSPPAPGGS